MAVARIKLLRNKRQVVVKQMRRDIALLLQSGQDSTARIRVRIIFLSFSFRFFVDLLLSTLAKGDLMMCINFLYCGG